LVGTNERQIVGCHLSEYVNCLNGNCQLYEMSKALRYGFNLVDWNNDPQNYRLLGVENSDMIVKYKLLMEITN
jgi:hypothetical protein